MFEYAAFLRGINVGGHHKVPMERLKKCIERIGFGDVKTLLNSGNVVFTSEMRNVGDVEALIESGVSDEFGFAIPTMVVGKQVIDRLIKSDVFTDVDIRDDIRLYMSIVRAGAVASITLPMVYDDGAFQIISQNDRMIASVLDLSKSKTVKGMDALEKLFGKDITTRNWNTILKVAKLF